jgi:hypothetical protein
MIFFPLCLYFFPLRPCNNCSTFTGGVLRGKYGKREIKSYNVSKNYGKLGKKSSQEGTLYYIFPPTILIVTLKRAQKFNWGKIYDIFSPCLYFFLLGPCNNCFTFTDGVLGGKI